MILSLSYWRKVLRDKYNQWKASRQPESRNHEWDWEKGDGEKCIHCGQADWMPGASDDCPNRPKKK